MFVQVVVILILSIMFPAVGYFLDYRNSRRRLARKVEKKENLDLNTSEK
ncbi:MAG: hypothetical protein MUE85_01905 [Microscillaceae bacterium]|jgi:hypothetical protein|nr:hypothetical protein [Microscillaceae bacterium]